MELKPMRDCTYRRKPRSCFRKVEPKHGSKIKIYYHFKPDMPEHHSLQTNNSFQSLEVLVHHDIFSVLIKMMPSKHTP
jgi:hypothetical protein